MEQVELGEFSGATKFDTFSKEDLITRLTVVEEEYHRAVREIYRLKNHDLTDEQLKLIMEEKLGELQAALYGASSERYKNPLKPKKEEGSKGPPKPRVKRPSERYPNVPVREEIIAMDPVPDCTICTRQMKDSGMTENSEQLTVIPKKFEIVVKKRVKYGCCGCHACIQTAPAPARIVEGSSYSDEMILDVALSKYCDLIPVHRYVAMAGRSGVRGLPSQSLIELTHGLSDFVTPAYDLIKNGVMKSRVLNADETPHRMLEGSSKQSWYLWGFSTPQFCFLECHDTRSGDIASDILKNSKCEILVTDVYAGYGKAIRISNELRQPSGLPIIQNANCNAHARRYFFKSWPAYKEGQYYLEQYQEIYELNEKAKGRPPPIVLELRSQMRPFFEAMKEKATQQLSSYSEKSRFGKALRYFIQNYEGLTLFLTDAEVPIDNNMQERLLRNHVVGRKTWYGTHSKRGAKTAAVLFSLVETCKLNQVNPREYFNHLTQELLAGRKPITPSDFQLSQ